MDLRIDPCIAFWDVNQILHHAAIETYLCPGRVGDLAGILRRAGRSEGPQHADEDLQPQVLFVAQLIGAALEVADLLFSPSDTQIPANRAAAATLPANLRLMAPPLRAYGGPALHLVAPAVA